MMRVFSREEAERCKASTDRHLNLPLSSGPDECEGLCGLKSVIVFESVKFCFAN